MAERLVFLATENDDVKFYEEKLVSFTYSSGFAITQKQKSIKSLHENAKILYPKFKILEVSTKSEEALGVQLSAFNLQYYDEISDKFYHIENVFQASKKYEFGGPYTDLLLASPGQAKGDTRHHTSGKLQSFILNDWACPLEPKTMFYDWIYCKALFQNKRLADELIRKGYNAFTDIEFNQKKSINCQARAAAIFVSLSKKNQLELFLSDKNLWSTVYTEEKKEQESDSEQLRFDFFM